MTCEEQALRMQRAVEIGLCLAMRPEAAHKQWVIDQMLRVLLGDQYDATIEKACQGVPYNGTWDTGAAP